MAGGNLSTVGTGVLAAARTSMYTGIDEVKELEILPKERLIRLNETLSRNQVYAEDEDFAFVASYIQARCRNAKVKGEDYTNRMQQQFCSNCGAKLNPGSSFCANCGTKV